MLPTGTVTMLFTDIEGSTQLLRRLGADYAAAPADHDAILRQAIERWGGRVVGLRGDGFFAAFGRASDAVNAAVAAQRALVSHPWPGGEAVRVRMGLHTGERRSHGPLAATPPMNCGGVQRAVARRLRPTGARPPLPSTRLRPWQSRQPARLTMYSP
jgi:class 3 adenylate cyclase